MDLPVAFLVENRKNPRKHFDEARLGELAASIKRDGVLQNLVVRPLAEGDRVGVATHEVIAGNRRLRAARMAGLTTVPCRIFTDVDDVEALRTAIAENDLREDLDPVERAEGYRQLELLGMKQKEIGAAVGKSQPVIANMLRILDLPADVQELVRKGEGAGGITASHAVAIAGLKSLDGVPSRLAELAVAQTWTSGQTESVCQELKKLAQWPELVEACLEPTGNALRRELNLADYGYIDPGIAKRVQLILDRHSAEERKRTVEEDLRKGGKTVLATEPGYGNKAYIELGDYDEAGRIHKQLGFTCEAFYVENGGRTRRYCTDPHALRSAVASTRKQTPLTPYELEERERKAKAAARARARDEAITSWIATFDHATLGDLEMIARRRLDVNWYGSGPHPLTRVATWLGLPGKTSAERLAAVMPAMKKWSGKDLILGWLLSEISREISDGEPVPAWFQPWLASNGYVDPTAPPPPIETIAPAAITEPAVDDRCRQPVTCAYTWRERTGASRTLFSCRAHEIFVSEEAYRPGPGGTSVRDVTEAESGKLRCSWQPEWERGISTNDPPAAPMMRCGRPAAYRLEFTHVDGSVTYRAVCGSDGHMNLLDREEDEKAGVELTSELVDPIPGETCEASAPRMCRVCGCTDECGCEEGCSWIEADLCSGCADLERMGITRQEEPKEVANA